MESKSIICAAGISFIGPVGIHGTPIYPYALLSTYNISKGNLLFNNLVSQHRFILKGVAGSFKFNKLPAFILKLQKQEGVLLPVHGCRGPCRFFFTVDRAVYVSTALRLPMRYLMNSSTHSTCTRLPFSRKPARKQLQNPPRPQRNATQLACQLAQLTTFHSLMLVHFLCCQLADSCIHRSRRAVVGCHNSSFFSR